jgi:predicted transposase/invertase (TIGR01784 family)
LPKFTKSVDELVTNQEKSCYFFKYTSEIGNMEKRIEDSPLVIKRAYDELAAYHWSDAELADYEASRKAERDTKAREDFVRKEGRIEGKAEVVHNMLAKGLTIEQIAELAGLSQEEIKQLGK